MKVEVNGKTYEADGIYLRKRIPEYTNKISYGIVLDFPEKGIVKFVRLLEDQFKELKEQGVPLW